MNDGKNGDIKKAKKTSESSIQQPNFPWILSSPVNKRKNLLLIQKFVRESKDSKNAVVKGQSFEKAANLGP